MCVCALMEMGGQAGTLPAVQSQRSVTNGRPISENRREGTNGDVSRKYVIEVMYSRGKYIQIEHNKRPQHPALL